MAMSKDYGSGAEGACPTHLRAWYRERRRDLPWREATGPEGLRAPYPSWIAEVMAQQTRIDVVVPYFEAFLARFPTVEALAAAPEEELLAAWAGLGYYRRARFLQAAARQVVEAGSFPEDAAGWQELPGIGPYTAAAIASLVHGERQPVVDGNVKRVVARLEDLELRRDEGALHRAAEQAGEAWMRRLPVGDVAAAGELNEALMELGATVCLPKNPDCAACPWSAPCRALAAGRAAAVPLPPRKRATVDRELHCLLLGDADAVHLERRVEGWNPGFLEPPLVEGASAREAFERAAGLAAGAKLGSFSHHITHHRLRVEVWHYPEGGDRPRISTEGQALTTIARKALALLAGKA